MQQRSNKNLWPLTRRNSAAILSTIYLTICLAIWGIAFTNAAPLWAIALLSIGLCIPLYWIISQFQQAIHQQATLIVQKENEVEDANNRTDKLQRHLTFLANCLPASIAYINKNYEVIYLNPHFQNWFGLSSSELKGQSLQSVLGEKIFEDYQYLLAEVQQNKASICFDDINSVLDQAPRYGRTSFIPLLDQQEDIQGYLMYIEDITQIKEKEIAMRKINLQIEAEALERQKAVRALQEGEMRYRTLFENNSLGVLTTDQYLNITKINRAFCQLLGYTEQELEHLSLCDISPHQKIEAYKEAMNQMINKKLTTFNLEHTLYARHGEQIEVLVSVTALYDKNGVFYESVAVVSNITEKKKAQEKLMKVNKELQQFASVASHDMKEPLRTISSFSELLARRIDDDPSKQEFLHFIRDAAKRMTVLLEDLITYARAGMENQPKKAIDLNDVLLSVQNNLYSTIQQTESKIISGELPTVYGHFTPFTQLFQNIIANGIKFQKKGTKPKIKIEALMLNDEYLIQISDNGIGMDKENVQRIFAPFSRLHSRVEYEGSGIGLATCKKIVERYEGQIWVDSKLDEGTTFFLSFPLNMICTPKEEVVWESKPL